MNINEMNFRKFDVVEILQCEQDIVELLNDALRAGGPILMMSALEQVIRAVGLGAVAGKSGLGRESLYKTLRPGKKPRFDTMVKILDSIGLTFTIQVKPKERVVEQEQEAP